VVKKPLPAAPTLLAPAPPPQVLHPRQPPKHAGDMPKTCDNCQHFAPMTSTARGGECHNGISGRLTTMRINGCAYGFFPSITKFPLKAGPGGVR
jgi:hypothetical protein